MNRLARVAPVAALGTVVAVVAFATGACSSSAATDTQPTDASADGSLIDLGDGAVTPVDDAAIPLGPACGDPAAVPGFTARRTVSFGGRTGTYSLFLGDRYDGHTLLPVVFALHGDGGDGQSMRGAGLEEASGGGAILVYPDGPNRTWDLETPAAQNQDYRFFEALVADVKASLCVAPGRVFAFGMSRGAFFANQLGCFESDLLKATSSNSGGGPYSNDGNDFDEKGFFKCPKPAIAALVIHGEQDDVVNYAAGTKARDHWRLRNGCGTSTAPWGPAPCVKYDGCPAGHDVGWCSIPGMGHQIWSSAGTAAWSFFSTLP